jgi:hypothetical protein
MPKFVALRLSNLHECAWWLDLLVTPGRCTSKERAHWLRPWQMERAAILGDRVLKPHLHRRRGAPHLSTMLNSGRVADRPGDRGRRLDNARFVARPD